MSTDLEWLRQMADAEDTCSVNVGAGMTADELSEGFEGMAASGWQITEEPIENDGPYNSRVIGWRVTAGRNGISITEVSPYRSQAREKVYARARLG